MAKYYHRPVVAVDYGDLTNEGSGNLLGDGNDGTGKYYMDGGSILVFPTLSSASLPLGKAIIAVSVGHRIWNGGVFGLFNGWPSTYLRVNNVREDRTRIYKQDGNSGARREQLGPPLYKPALAPWTVAEINTMSADTGSAVGTIGPNTNNRWCAVAEVFIAVVTEEPVPVPNSPFPAAGQTINTSSVNFSAVIPAVQLEQPVAAVFQVARDAAFTQDVRTFVGGANQNVSAGSRSYYASIKTEDSYTNLGPGQWFLRMKGRDMRGTESASWSATSSFTIQHTALPVPQLVSPVAGSTVATPYAPRTARFVEQPSGDRRVGVTWQFSKDPGFASGVVEWSNRTGGIMLASANEPGVVSYDPQPNTDTFPGGFGGTVSVEDPSQYLAQGSWYARVKATDVFGQSGAWSGNYSFTVSHVPIPADPAPALGASFDQALGMLRWRFTDPWSGDSQSAYRVVVKDSAGTTIQDTGKVASAVPRAPISISDSLLRTLITWSVTIWDADDIPSAPVTSTFRLSKAPQVTVPYPAADEQIITGQPQVTWSNVYAAAGIGQKSAQIRFTRIANGTVEFDTGIMLGASQIYLPPRAILKNLIAYQMAVMVTDTENLTGTLLRNFSTNYQRPAPVECSADASTYSENGYTTIVWGQADPDQFFMEWRIYYRKRGTEEWIYTGKVEDPSIRSYRDWMIAGSGEFEYAVTQAAYRFGSIVESEFPNFSFPITIHSDSYWLISPGHEELNVRLHHVVADKFTRRRESAEYAIIGGGRRRNLGTKLGKEGSLSCTIRASQSMSAADQLDALEALEDSNRWVMMKDPFGRVTKISIGEISTDRIPGTGIDEFADLEIPYFEVS